MSKFWCRPFEFRHFVIRHYGIQQNNLAPWLPDVINPQMRKICRVLGCKMSVYVGNGHLEHFKAIWYILWPFGIRFELLVYFMTVWYSLRPFGVYLFSRFGKLHQKIWQPLFLSKHSNDFPSTTCAQRFFLGAWLDKDAFWAGLPDFSLWNIPKRKIYAKLPSNIPNCHTLFQTAVK
jgi:hypothetical protein